jgi:hypothetical protein
MIGFYVLGGAALLSLVEVIFIEIAWKRGRKYGWKAGYEEGLKDGKIDADNWWIRAEEQTDEARMKMWKEGV